MSIGDRVRIAIETECSASKAGNVHPHASFRDLNCQHFFVAAKAIGYSIDRCIGEPIGQIVLQSVVAMMEAVGTNTSLGTILLMSPLAAATNRMERGPHGLADFRDHLQKSIAELSANDSRDIYEAICIAKPGGLGESESMDIRQSAPPSILEAMKVAAEWDDVALQYVSKFELVFVISNRIARKTALGLTQTDSIRSVQMELLSERVDSLIARKQGRDYAQRVKSQACEVIQSGPYGSAEYETAWLELDAYLRDDEHRGNPGTIADLIAAALFLS